MTREQRYREKYPERVRASQQAYENRNALSRHLRRFGLTLDEYAQMDDDQNWLCAICMQSCATGQRLSVDHDHATEEVRSLLCRNCNAGLGNFHDSLALIQKAVTYLQSHGAI